MRWPWQRRRDDDAHDPAAGTAGGAPVPSVPRPRGQWRDVEPLQPAGATELSAAEPLGFVRTLATRWQVPPALEPLGHEVSITAPAGHVPVAGAPVTGYPDPPELVWAAVPEVAAEETADAGWRRAPARADGPAAEPAPLAPPRSEVAVDPLPAPRSAPLDRPEAPVAALRVHDLVGDREPLPQSRSHGVDEEGTVAVDPVRVASSDDGVHDRPDLPLRRGATAGPTAGEEPAARCRVAAARAPRGRSGPSCGRGRHRAAPRSRPATPSRRQDGAVHDRLAGPAGRPGTGRAPGRRPRRARRRDSRQRRPSSRRSSPCARRAAVASRHR